MLIAVFYMGTQRVADRINTALWVAGEILSEQSDMKVALSWLKSSMSLRCLVVCGDLYFGGFDMRIAIRSDVRLLSYQITLGLS